MHSGITRQDLDIKFRLAFCILFRLSYFSLRTFPACSAHCRKFIPESPRWLTTHGKHDQALRALKRLRRSACPEEDILIEMNEICETTRIEQELGHDVSFFDIFRGTDLRRTILAVLSSSCQAGSGINLVVGYSTYFCTVANISNPFAISLVRRAIGILTSLAATKMMSVFRRRPMFITGEILAAIALFIVAGMCTGPQTAATGKVMFAFSIIYTQVSSPYIMLTAGLRCLHRTCLLDKCV
jgi:hypothetical protein